MKTMLTIKKLNKSQHSNIVIQQSDSCVSFNRKQMEYHNLLLISYVWPLTLNNNTFWKVSTHKHTCIRICIDKNKESQKTTRPSFFSQSILFFSTARGSFCFHKKSFSCHKEPKWKNTNMNNKKEKPLKKKLFWFYEKKNNLVLV